MGWQRGWEWRASGAGVKSCPSSLGSIKWRQRSREDLQASISPPTEEHKAELDAVKINGAALLIYIYI